LVALMNDATRDASGSQPLSRAGKIAFISFLTLVSLVTLSVLAPFILMMKFSIPASSMYPSLQIGDYLLAAPLAYDSSLERGEIALMYVGEGERRSVWVKRIIGLPGDRIAVREGQLIINGSPVERRAIGTREIEHGASVPAFEETLPGGRTIEVLDADPNSPFDNFREVTVPADHYFVLGDNRDNSYDSRAMDRVGFIPREAFVGKPKIIYFSWGEQGLRLGRIGTWIR
jgi:signal peptidase I